MCQCDSAVMAAVKCEDLKHDKCEGELCPYDMKKRCCKDCSALGACGLVCDCAREGKA